VRHVRTIKITMQRLMLKFMSVEEEERSYYGDLRHYTVDHIVKHHSDKRLYRIHQKIYQEDQVVRVILLHLHSPERLLIDEPFFSDWQDLGHI
jgi:hypothetical protein